MCALHDLLRQAIIRDALHGRFFRLHQPIFDESGHNAAHGGVFSHAFRDVRFRPEALVIIGHAFVPHAEFAVGFVNHREYGRHAPHDALRP